MKPKPPFSIEKGVKESWKTIAPLWPLSSIIAVNPLQGFEEMTIEQALVEGRIFFQQTELPSRIEGVNRETIKWLQPFFDEGQATFPMPLREKGLYTAWKTLARYDKKLHGGHSENKQWIGDLPDHPLDAITAGLSRLGISEKETTLFLTLLLTTLSGWAAYVKYLTDWKQGKPSYPISQLDYLAVRVIITALKWPEASRLLDWHRSVRAREEKHASLLLPTKEEERYHQGILDQLERQFTSQERKGANAYVKTTAQLVFCIDVRSEPFRRALEQVGPYETLGFAGFFGVPVAIEDKLTGESYPSCPVLLAPKHVVEVEAKDPQKRKTSYERGATIKRFYQTLKYTFSAPFGLVELLGLGSGVWMGIRNFFPHLSHPFKKSAPPLHPKIAISFAEKVSYGEGALRMMGLTEDFAPLVVFCGHGGTTQNNAYASALDCGACAGRHGGANAQVLAEILNDQKVRKELEAKGIKIPDSTLFLGAAHNTTTDACTLYGTEGLDPKKKEEVEALKKDLEEARHINNQVRVARLGLSLDLEAATAHTKKRSGDWSQVRPEWGLAKNGAFIVGPRDLTKDLDLEGRAFLHSYDYQKDGGAQALTTILTAPMVVAQWINTQYLFSMLDNVAYGGGSKVTKNITGKMGIMQGNASDLMQGLPLQSVYKSDCESYHDPFRLMTVVYAPREMLSAVIKEQEVLQKLFKNGWVKLACIDSEERRAYQLGRDLSWSPASSLNPL
ncbi:DUF2309 domain-containing protein [Candidatus Neptunochlamydia vexilliferae]|nr:DUF2309 domain-containing protein [Candidatus Neptunochlamydia vexilliferae]